MNAGHRRAGRVSTNACAPARSSLKNPQSGGFSRLPDRPRRLTKRLPSHKDRLLGKGLSVIEKFVSEVCQYILKINKERESLNGVFSLRWDGMDGQLPLMYAFGVLALENQHTQPVLSYNQDPADQQQKPEVTDSVNCEAVEARERVDHFMREHERGYYGHGHRTVFITAPKMSSVMDCSHDTGYRWLERFTEAGLLNRVGDVNQTNLYKLREPFRTIERDGEFKTPEEVATTASELREIVLSA